MKNFLVGELKANFSSVLDMIKQGEVIVISYRKKKTKLAIILPYSQYIRNHPRKLGLLKNKGPLTIEKISKYLMRNFLIYELPY